MSRAKFWFWSFALFTVKNLVMLSMGNTDFDVFGLIVIPRAIWLVFNVSWMLGDFKGAPMWLRLWVYMWARRAFAS